MNLTDKQENFAISYVTNGGNATQAYRDNYDVGETTSDNTVWVAAHKVLHNDKVSTRIAELRKSKFSPKILTLEERKTILSDMAIEGDLKALDILNKMDGAYTEKIEHSGEVNSKRTIVLNPTKNDK